MNTKTEGEEIRDWEEKFEPLYNSGNYPLTPYRRFCGVLRRMAVLWEQRELVKALDGVSKKSMANAKEIISGFAEKDTKNAKYFKQHYVTGSIGDHYVYENELLNYFLDKDKKTTLDVAYVVNYQRVLESCIKDKFISHIENDDFGKEDVGDIKQTSGRMIQVSYDKGSELLNGTYFWWKYLAGVFPPLTTIIVTIITAILTSGAIWLFVWKQLNDKIITNEQFKTEISQPSQ